MNSTYLFNKLFIFNFAIYLFNNYKANSAIDPLIIKGNVPMVELNEDIPLYLSMVEGHPFAYLNILIYVDNALVIKDREISKYLNNKCYSLNGFTVKNAKKKIKIDVNYEDKDAISSVCEFTIYSPNYRTVKNAGKDVLKYTENNAINVSFQMQGNNQTVENEYEELVFNGTWAYECIQSRFFDFSKYSISSSNIALQDSILEFKIFTHFKDSDLLYKNDYTSIDIIFKKQNDNSLRGENEFKYYIDKNTGMIFENETINCDKENLPFFFPFNLSDDNLVLYSFSFFDVGKNHNSFVYTGIINLHNIENNHIFGSFNDFYYQEKEPIKDVIYA
ncbi:MAG: hypothetical protein SOU19_08390 [Candidatus Caccosoma sp.]|nr:hypothetical protein [Candidatus Caccosoma sp.]